MGIQIHQKVVAERLRPADHSRFLRLVDDSFGCRAPATLGTAFPTALAADNREHQFVLREGDELVAGAAVLKRPWKTSQGRLSVACLGCFATREDRRGEGHSRRLQEWMLEELRGEGVDLALLWTDRPEFYRRRGFEAVGLETHLRLSLSLRAEARPGDRIRAATSADARALLEIYRNHPYRSERRQSDMELYLSPGVSTVAILERQGAPVAYAALGKGLDFEGYVHEYAGAVADVHVLWQALVAEGARTILIPEGAENYAGGAAQGLPRLQRRSAWGRRLDADSSIDSLASLRWAAWGFDSA